VNARALKIAAREVFKLADSMSRPLADDLNLIAEDLAKQAAELEEIHNRRDTFRQRAPRSGANGSNWPRLVENHLNKF
jgi:hypothetical protein